MKISDQGRVVVLNYLQSAEGLPIAERARAAIYRYTDLKIPTLDEIKKRHGQQELEKLDTLVLRMEYEAKRLPPDTEL